MSQCRSVRAGLSNFDRALPGRSFGFKILWLPWTCVSLQSGSSGHGRWTEVGYVRFLVALWHTHWLMVSSKPVSSQTRL